VKYFLKDETIIENCIAQIRNSLGMTVTIKKEKRSLDQNALMWVLLQVLSDYTGDDTETLHERLKVSFLGVEYRTVKGIDLVVPKSTASLNTKKFTAYIDKIYMLGDTLSLKLPRPPHYGYEDEK
jgi:hypothetical protein